MVVAIAVKQASRARVLILVQIFQFFKDCRYKSLISLKIARSQKGWVFNSSKHKAFPFAGNI
jgi:hypothetical protein